MQYSAFFRYVKINYPNKWKQFVEQIKNIEFSPTILTPTKWNKYDLEFSRRVLLE